ncbi:MAG TPA: hypothetical protein DCG75_15295 [Bacteroidales bacterium]|nr:hypothetical protein [Bacteroidales bacterium]
MKSKIIIGIIVLVAIWITGIIVDFDELATKKPNPEYQKYIAEYKAETEKKYNDIIDQLDNDYRIQFNEEKSIRVDDCIGSNFEGAEVKLAGIQIYDSIFRKKSKTFLYL